jgi:hypothetical protein
MHIALMSLAGHYREVQAFVLLSISTLLKLSVNMVIAKI